MAGRRKIHTEERERFTLTLPTALLALVDSYARENAIYATSGRNTGDVDRSAAIESIIKEKLVK